MSSQQEESTNHGESTTTSPSSLSSSSSTIETPFSMMNNLTQSVESNSLSDVDAISLQDIPENMCVINVPFIYIDADLENPNDRVIPNLRAIDYKIFTELMELAITIPQLKNDESADLTHKLINRLISNISHISEIKPVIDFLEYTTDMSRKFDLDDDYFDITCESISFDMIRKYITDDYGILKSIEPTTYKQAAFYSQITDANDVLMARQQNNDTDFNRMQLTLTLFEKSLTFQPGYMYDKSVKLTNLALFYMVLYTISRPIDKLCSANLRSNMIAYILDVIVRTRIIQGWQRVNSSNKLLADLIKNYDSNNYIVGLCRLRTPKERANYMIKTMNDMQSSPELRDDPNLKNISLDTIIQSLNYEWYEQALQTTLQTIDGKSYYVFTSDFVLQITSKLPNLLSHFNGNTNANDDGDDDITMHE